ncbi:MAG: di-trans,poly-cis-decaprenylcistransferase [Proteobacteria bacterium]|nr:MAG: di-trans,poly-cis-decaprenylcistransferase [Pseudomonadota bacterium]
MEITVWRQFIVRSGGISAALFQLLISYLKGEVEKLHANGVRLKSIGNTDRLPVDCQEWLKHVEQRTADNKGLTLVLALSYGGRSDLVTAFQSIAQDVAKGLVRVEDVTESLIQSRLSTSFLPEPDLLIRTSGEQRLSNFLLWEMAYTEFYFTPIHWPDFSKEDFAEALSAFADRERRFGGLLTP